ncbi:hypothetical protein PF010_g2708 [Phytophthora fragariae]|uniref:Uncharacterized protein n=1 Tax=Phytophthora fragariae TaxID=53985 RepID=A0A6A3M4J8_9STRA|nr:hypothetical protein PF003_g35688 [Phytophthora fragariae]KAE8947081.1 hypothetical protein PF009_g3305 [Phytophthora fragariae]KAE9026566.1 hypothetical protein PF011_g2484 [Phytophthora fragariae]KAE9133723.1 hypothetical protein PF010_g2708 [Phytophthora fragariae]KAE9134385.1 hypothetical protein PF007_g2958 [Phytophthora fragariae]
MKMIKPTLATSVVSGISDEVVDVVADEDVDADMDEDMSMMNMVKEVEGLDVAVGAKGLEDVAFTVESKVTSCMTAHTLARNRQVMSSRVSQHRSVPSIT